MLGIAPAATVAWLQGAAAALSRQDTAAADTTAAVAAQAVHAAPDSIRMDTSPLPGGVASVFRFLFSGVPQWIQIAGVVVGVIAAVVLAVVAWRRRAAIGAWLASRSHGYKVALGAGVGTTLLAAGLVGGWSYNYMMHENDFCSSCHVMSSAFGRFQKSEHSKLECHACHQQSIFASAKELYYWVMERPEAIPAHSPVPNRICGECHITQRRDSVWQFISATAGHQVHMESDSSALREVMCVSCHGKEVHAFAPVDLSCKQSGCHDDVKVRLGKMADQTSLHCSTCHEFARPVAETAPIDSGRQGLVPLKPQCFTCHEMREKLAERGLDKDPHNARCGDCHNPHDQTTAIGAVKSCQSAGCHASADTLTAFHRGLGSHALDDCVSCHVAHTWKVESTDCLSCHKTIFEDRPPRRSLLRRVSAPAQPHAAAPGGRRRSGGPSAAEENPLDDADADPRGGAWAVPATQATQAVQQRTAPVALPEQPFQHSRHRKLACETCHRSDARHGELVVRDAASCQACHHARDERAGSCSTCHTPAELTAPHERPVSMRVSGRPDSAVRTIQRSLTFEHARHAQTSCATCHDDGVARAVVKECTSCHADHHVVQRTCTNCHPTPRTGHTRDAHDGCASCHRDQTVAALPPAQGVCLSCHAEQRTHYPARDCVTCHRVSWNELRHGEGRR